MSSSLFADCYIPYPEYKKTWTRKGDKTFGDLKAGDIFYFCGVGNGLGELDSGLEELVVEESMYEVEEHIYLKYRKKGKKKIYILNFGETCCWNARESYNNSMVADKVDYTKGIIGTTKESLLDYVIDSFSEELKKIEQKRQYIINSISTLQALK